MKALFFILVFLFSTSSLAKVKVVATTSSLASLVKEIGKDNVDVLSISNLKQDPHYIEAKPSYMVKLRSADVLVSVGLGLESGWLPNVIRGSKRPDLLSESGQKHLVVGKFINPIEIPAGKIDRSKGDVHAEGNPHFQYDPIEVNKVVVAISDKLSEIDKDRAQFYQAQKKSFEKKLLDSMAQWKHRVENSQVKYIVSYHKSFSYFLNRFNLNLLGEIEPKAGVPPTAKHIISLIKKIKSKKRVCILSENYFEKAAARRLHKKTNAQFVGLDVEFTGSYFDFIDKIVSAIESCSKE